MAIQKGLGIHVIVFTGIMAYVEAVVVWPVVECIEWVSEAAIDICDIVVFRTCGCTLVHALGDIVELTKHVIWKLIKFDRRTYS